MCNFIYRYQTFDTPTKKYSNSKEDTIEIYESYIKRSWCTDCKKEDETLGWQDKHYEGEDFALKSHITGVEASWNEKDESWETIIFSTNPSNDMVNGYQTKEQCFKVRDRILSWLLKLIRTT